MPSLYSRRRFIGRGIYSIDFTFHSTPQVTFVDFGSSVVVSLHKLRRLFPKVIHLFWIRKTFWQANYDYLTPLKNIYYYLIS